MATTVEITAGRDEVVILTYEDSSTVTISSDRSDVPADGQVHITISDFQLNLDPTAADEWTLNTGASDKTYVSIPWTYCCTLERRRCNT